MGNIPNLCVKKLGKGKYIYMDVYYEQDDPGNISGPPDIWSAPVAGCLEIEEVTFKDRGKHVTEIRNLNFKVDGKHWDDHVDVEMPDGTTLVIMFDEIYESINEMFDDMHGDAKISRYDD